MRNWNERDHPRGQPDNAGQFVEKDGQNGQYTSEGKSWRQNTGYGEILAEGKDGSCYVKLPKREYAEFCSAIRTKYAGSIPVKGQILYGENYYQFQYSRHNEQIICTLKLSIKDNEQLINDIMEDF